MLKTNKEIEEKICAIPFIQDVEPNTFEEIMHIIHQTRIADLEEMENIIKNIYPPDTFEDDENIGWDCCLSEMLFNIQKVKEEIGK
jgi:tetrahydromethanopterin S-methyltransferase subunit A